MFRKEQKMKANQDLIGKTITGVIAVSQPEEGVREIWMLQFSDGTHVEFVSPEGRRRLKRSVRRKKAPLSRPANALQLALNVA
jgi:hypothetical protein